MIEMMIETPGGADQFYIIETPSFPQIAIDVFGEDLLKTVNLNVANYMRSVMFRKGMKKEEVRRVVAQKIADILSTKNAPIWLSKKDWLLAYNEKKGIYEEIETVMNCILSKVTPDFATSDRKEILNLLKLYFATNDDKFEEASNGIIGVLNGVVDIHTKELRSHSPYNRLLTILPIEYNPFADCPEFKKFLNSIVDPEDIDLLEEWMGYCLTNDYRYQKALMLQGGGSNGKSTFINVITTLLGRDNVSSVSLQSLSISRFAAAELYQKKANIYADLPKEALKASDMFKALTGGDWITVERKFKDPFRFKNSAKLLFSANAIPETEDMSDAFYRRWSIIIFPNQFIGKAADSQLEERLKTPNELSGIFNLALEGLDRLNKRKRFIDSENIDHIRLLYLRLSDSIAAFVQEEIEPTDDNSSIVKQDIFTYYQTYCRKMKLPPQTEKKFFMRVPQLVRVQEFRPNDEERRPSWRWIRLRPGQTAADKMKDPLEKKTTDSSGQYKL